MVNTVSRETVLFDTAGGREFRLLRCLGEGGFGSVYLALLRSPGGLEQRVAVKLLHPDTDARSQAVERLRDEARVLASLHHPVILVAHDLVQLEDQVALVTEYVEGQDLGEVMADPVDPIPTAALIDVVGQVAGALDAAWSTAGIVHRDVKPANIRIGRHGNVKLLDFGIAKSGLGPARTQTNVVLGSLVYMAPERFERGRPLSPASDVFALGCVLFEGIARSQLFNRMDAARMFGLAMTPAQFDDVVTKRLMRVESSVVRDLLREMLLRDPEVRIAAADVPLACDQVQAALPGRETLRTWCRRRRWPDVAPEETTPASTPPPAAPVDPMELPPAAPDGGTTMNAGWSAGLNLQPRNTPSAAPAAEVEVPPTEPVSATPTPKPRVVLARTVPPAAPANLRAAEIATLIDTGTLAPLAPARPNTRWRWVGAAVSMLAMVAVMGVVVAVGISAIGLLIASGRDPAPDEAPLPPLVPEKPVEIAPAPEPLPVAPEPEPEPDRERDAEPERPEPARPRPEPVPVAAPAVVPEPEPAPAVEIAPEPVVEEAAFGVVRARENRPFELRSDGHVTLPGDRVPAGTYTMYVDFGKGWVSGGLLTVTPGSAALVSCNSVTWKCEAKVTGPGTAP